MFHIHTERVSAVGKVGKVIIISSVHCVTDLHALRGTCQCTGICKKVCPRLRELALAARGSQEAGFTQPRDHSFADPCRVRTLRASREAEDILRSGDLSSSSYPFLLHFVLPFLPNFSRRRRLPPQPHSMHTKLLVRTSFVRALAKCKFPLRALSSCSMARASSTESVLII